MDDHNKKYSACPHILSVVKLGMESPRWHNGLETGQHSVTVKWDFPNLV